MSPYTKFTAVCCVWLCFAHAFATPAPDQDSGVVTSQSITVAGHEFCQYFIAAWRDKEGAGNYTLAIRERPSARRGSEVWVEFAQRRVFEARLPPGRSAIKAMSEEAAESTLQAVLETDAQRKLFIDADLAPDEL